MHCSKLNDVNNLFHNELCNCDKTETVFLLFQGISFVYPSILFKGINSYCFFGSEGHVALDRNSGPGYDTLLLRMITGDLLSACPHRQFHTLPDLLDSRAALSDSYPSALRAMQGGSSYHFYGGLWYDPAECHIEW